jgi:prevent-host-death family protein
VPPLTVTVADVSSVVFVVERNPARVRRCTSQPGSCGTRQESLRRRSTLRATLTGVELIGVRELRQHASRYLARVEAGEELGVTNNGRLVARLVPVQAATRSREALIDTGALLPARRPQNLFDVAATPARDNDRTLSDVLNEMRDER